MRKRLVYRAGERFKYWSASIRNGALSTQAHDAAAERLAESESAHESLEQYEKESQLFNAMNGLNHPQMQVVWLYMFCDMTFKQVAEELGVSEYRVKTVYRQSLAILKQRLSSPDNQIMDRRMELFLHAKEANLVSDDAVLENWLKTPNSCFGGQLPIHYTFSDQLLVEGKKMIQGTRAGVVS